MLIGYARVSTEDQNLALQIDALRAAGCHKIFSEKKSTRAKHRPVIAEALAYLRPGDTLVVWKLDRLDRTTSELVLFLETLSHTQIQFRSLTEALDTTTAIGRMLYHITAAFTELERSVIRERTIAGLQAATAAGKILGRPAKLDPEKLQIARAMLTDPKIRVTDVAKQLSVSTSTLYRHLPAARRNAT